MVSIILSTISLVLTIAYAVFAWRAFKREKENAQVGVRRLVEGIHRAFLDQAADIKDALHKVESARSAAAEVREEQRKAHSAKVMAEFSNFISGLHNDEQAKLDELTANGKNLFEAVDNSITSVAHLLRREIEVTNAKITKLTELVAQLDMSLVLGLGAVDQDLQAAKELLKGEISRVKADLRPFALIAEVDGSTPLAKDAEEAVRSACREAVVLAEFSAKVDERTNPKVDEKHVRNSGMDKQRMALKHAVAILEKIGVVVDPREVAKGIEVAVALLKSEGKI